MYRLATATATTDTNTALRASYTYDNDLLTAIQTGSTTYSFSYGNFALRSNIKIGSRTLASYSYTTDRNNYLSALDYGNGDKVQYAYDKQGRVTKQTYEDGATVTYKYDNNGALATVTDSETGIKTTYYYDFTDRMMKYVENGTDYSHSVGYGYDTINNLTSIIETINETSYTTSYAYDADNRLTAVTNGDASKTYTYDGFSRSSQQQTKHSGTVVKTDSFTFNNPTTTTTSAQIASHVIASAGFNKNLSYTYDDNGNILTISDGTNTISYTYDSANQLIRENNQAGDYTYTWAYDDAGNILSKSVYGYTTDSLENVTPTDTISYTYGDTKWGDLLTGYDGNTITSDTIGNMLSDGTWTYTWKHGRQLATMSDGAVTWNYTYNADGLRTKRTDGTTTYEYIYNGSQLTQMSDGTNTLYFTYDASGTPLALIYNNSLYYYYVTNVQGDVIALVDSTGATVVEYTYDAWGNILTTTGLFANTIGTQNPLRYRGYVYDTETGLYYLQSRYYNPEMGRFICADEYTTTGQGLLGNNMFLYCGNNPVSRIDPSGRGWVAVVVGVAVGVAIGVVTSWIGSAVTGQEFTWWDAGFAALSGGVSYFGLPGLVAGGLISGGYSAYTAYEGGADLGGAIGSGVVSALLNMVSFGDLAQAGDDLVGIAISGFTDLVFGTGFSSMDAAVSKTLTKDNSASTSSNNRSALDVIRRKIRNSSTRIYNGQSITVGTKNCSYPGGLYNDPTKIYCFVQF